MKAGEMAQKLYTLGKRGIFANYQENELLKAAARMIQAMDKTIGELTEKVYELEETLAIREEMDHQGDPEIDRWPPDDIDEPLEAAAPGEAAEDFWEDDWPVRDEE